MMESFKQPHCDLEDVHYVGKLSMQQDGNQAVLFTVSHDGVVGFAFAVLVCPLWMPVLEQCTAVHRLVTLRNVRGGASLCVTPESQILHTVPRSTPKKRRPKVTSAAKKKRRRPTDNEWLPENGKK